MPVWLNKEDDRPHYMDVYFEDTMDELIKAIEDLYIRLSWYQADMQTAVWMIVPSRPDSDKTHVLACLIVLFDTKETALVRSD